jgi:hypothetical protein
MAKLRKQGDVSLGISVSKKIKTVKPKNVEGRVMRRKAARLASKLVFPPGATVRDIIKVVKKSVREDIALES